ncbi:uncharacterized protein F54H12.2-like [Haliotis asinina]|uniref:uncharacterized protein F54H12.2-like n=1 Tax=Haliotis asinina TaxID=109174 RepID=UPI003531E2E4
MQAILECGEEAKSSLLTRALYYRDSEVDSDDPIDGRNEGLFERGKFTKLSKSMKLSGVLFEYVFRMSRHLVSGVDVDVKVFHSNTPFMLMSAEKGKEYLIVLGDAYLRVCRLKINDALITAQDKQFEKVNALYACEKNTEKMAYIVKDNLDFNWDAMYRDKVPTRLVVGLVKSDGVNGSLNVNPFNFQGDIVKRIGVYMNGRSAPGHPYEANNIEVYNAMFEWDGNNIENRYNRGGLDISRNEFDKGYALYVFNLQDIGESGKYLNLLKYGNLRMEVEFTSALTNTFNVIALAKFPAVIEVNKTRNVFLK